MTYLYFYLIIKLDASENCDCPCLPKCCPKGKILVKNNDKIGTNHGFDCIDAPNDYSLPTVRMKHLNKTPSNQKFHPGVFPNCKGLATNWTYDFHFDDDKNNIQLEIEDIYDGISILDMKTVLMIFLMFLFDLGTTLLYLATIFCNKSHF